jgi:glycogenin glucosyltransferase
MSTVERCNAEISNFEENQSSLNHILSSLISSVSVHQEEIKNLTALSQKKRGAWVTLATNDNYALGALVLGQSLKDVGTTRKLHILVTTGVTDGIKNSLNRIYDGLTVVDVMDSKDEAHLSLIQRPELGVTFTKFHCWLLTEYQKCVFLDADCFVLQNCDELFNYPELSASPDIGWPDMFNSGVFVFVPSKDTFSSLLQCSISEGSFDGGDQGTLNTYFNSWTDKGHSHRLPFTYNMSTNIVYTYKAALKRFVKDIKIVHFIGAFKPWHHNFDPDMKSLNEDKEGLPNVEYIQQWWATFVKHILPHLQFGCVDLFPTSMKNFVKDHCTQNK